MGTCGLRSSGQRDPFPASLKRKKDFCLLRAHSEDVVSCCAFSPSVVDWQGDFHLWQMWLSFLCGWRGKEFISIPIIVHPPNAFMCDFECILPLYLPYVKYTWRFVYIILDPQDSHIETSCIRISASQKKVDPQQGERLGPYNVITFFWDHQVKLDKVLCIQNNF